MRGKPRLLAIVIGAPERRRVGRLGRTCGVSRHRWQTWSSPAFGAPRPTAWFVRRRQVSWLTAIGRVPRCHRSCLPKPSGSVAHPTWGWSDQRLAADSCGGSRRLVPGPEVQPGRTAFPFHPLARDHRHISISLYHRMMQVLHNAGRSGEVWGRLSLRAERSNPHLVAHLDGDCRVTSLLAMTGTRRSPCCITSCLSPPAR